MQKIIIEVLFLFDSNWNLIQLTFYGLVDCIHFLSLSFISQCILNKKQKRPKVTVNYFDWNYEDELKAKGVIRLKQSRTKKKIVRNKMTMKERNLSLAGHPTKLIHTFWYGWWNGVRNDDRQKKLKREKEDNMDYDELCLLNIR